MFMSYKGNDRSLTWPVSSKNGDLTKFRSDLLNRGRGSKKSSHLTCISADWDCGPYPLGYVHGIHGGESAYIFFLTVLVPC